MSRSKSFSFCSLKMNLDDVRALRGQQTRVFECFNGFVDGSGDWDYKKFLLHCKYVNGDTSWSDGAIHKLIWRPVQNCVSHNPEYMTRLIQDIEEEMKQMKRKDPGKGSKPQFKGLNPKIGYEETSEFPLELISYTYVLIEYYSHHKHWHLLTATILNTIDQSDMSLKAMGCKLLYQLITKTNINLDSTGLGDMFINTLKNNLYLSHWPLFESSFETLLQLLQKSTSDATITMIEGLNIVLMMIDKQFNRFGESGTDLIHYLQLLSQIIHPLSTKVLITMNRLNFILNQLITNVSILEYHRLDVIPLVLSIQSQIFDIFNHEMDKEGKWLLYDYRFDMLAAWKILSSRIDRVGGHVDLGRNTEQLGRLAKDLGEVVPEIEQI